MASAFTANEIPLRGAEEERDAGSKRDQLLDHHHDPCEALIGQRREAEQALVLSGVGRIQRMEREDQDVRENLPAAKRATASAILPERRSSPRRAGSIS